MIAPADEPDIPTYADLMFPTMVALDELGGTAVRADVDREVIKNEAISNEQLAVEYPDDAQQSGSKVVHRLAWARSYLRKLQAIESKGRGTWTLTHEGRHFLGLDDGAEEVKHREHELRVGKRPDVFLKQAQQRAQQGDEWSSTVRELLREWGVSRRGSAVVARISRDLAEAELQTRPPFDTVPLDAEITIAARRVQPVPAEQTEPSASPASSTVTIGTLTSADADVVSVPPDSPILTAQSLMESNDFSQLAVCSGGRSLKGAVSWESIAKATLYDDRPTLVQDAMDVNAVIVFDDEALLEHVGTIADAGFVFVKDRTNLLKGIVTAADLSGEFAKLANPFLLLGEIEGWLRQLVDATFSPDDLAGYVDPDDPDRQIEAALSLTFGEYVRLFQDPDAWAQLALTADRQVFSAHLDEVRRIRNSIMHFSPDPLLDSELSKITSLLSWVRTLGRAPNR